MCLIFRNVECFAISEKFPSRSVCYKLMFPIHYLHRYFTREANLQSVHFKNLSQGFSSFKLNFLLCICFSEQYFLWKHQTLTQSSLVHGFYMPCTFFTLLMSALVSMGQTSLRTKFKRCLYILLHPNLGSSIVQHHC